MSGITIKKEVTVSLTPVDGIDGSLSSSTVSVYPNSASTVLNVSAQGVEITSISLINSIGQTVLTASSGTVSLVGVPKGFYILWVKTTKGISRKHIVVNN